MNRSRPLLGCAIALLVVTGCGAEGGDPCPTGDCDVKGVTTVGWQFNHYPEWGFDSDVCNDVGAETVRVVATNVDNPDVTATDMVDCSRYQVAFLGLPPGTYDMVVTPFAADGTELLATPVNALVAAGAPDTPTNVIAYVPYTAWARPYTGTFLFKIAWAGASCDVAQPVVQTQVLTMTMGGQAVTPLTDMGQKLDGTDPKPCRPLNAVQFVTSLPMGPATFAVVGKDTADTIVFAHTFETFVGASIFNPTMMFDVPAPPPPPPPM
ncbi:MAG: hypothetical protein AB7O24_22355 [Kofleriaceae bacterium]